MYFSGAERIPQRWIFVILIFLAVINAYGIRQCLSIALTKMVASHKNVENESSAFEGGTLEWSEASQVKSTFIHESILKKHDFWHVFLHASLDVSVFFLNANRQL